jgi:sigma-B regulation protein RsbQ
MKLRGRLRATTSGKAGGPPLVFGHGYGTGQGMWRSFVPAFTDRYRTVTYDIAGRVAMTDRPLDRYDTLDAYAADLLGLCRELGLEDVAFVGHSVAGIIGVLAANAEPHRFTSLVLIGSSPRYVDDRDYVGGYTRSEVEDFLEVLDNNVVDGPGSGAPGFGGWSADRLDDARFARHFARAMFLSDHRADLQKVTVPTLILHGDDDRLVPRPVGEYLARTIPGSRLERVTDTGHVPHLDSPVSIVTAIRRFLDR